MKRVLAVLAIIAALSPVLGAQVDRATLTGVVKDSAGAVLPGATVTVTNTATNVSGIQPTTSSGSFLVVDLIPGPYEMTVELQGYKKVAQRFTLEVGQRARLDVALEIGNFAETVDVVGAPQLLNTADATLGAVIPQLQVANLPLAIRNWDDLLLLVPGVQQDRYSEQGGGTSFGRTGGINVHGARGLQNNFLLDGVDNNSISENVQELTTQVSRPSVDAIQEFKVVTSPYSAEYGRSPGAAVSVSTKSGTNSLHGTGYEYFRNQSMDAVDFFTRRAGAPKPANKQNQPGGNLGGPVVRNRAFFFSDYEATRITRGVSRLTRIPTADERRGIFTSAVNDPVTGLPFANNQIPTSRIDPYAAAILGLLPDPNQAGTNNYFRNANLLDNSDRVLTRLDLKPNAADNTFIRYIYSNRKREIPGAFGGVLDGTGTSAFGNQKIRTNGVVAGWTHVLSNRMVNEARFSWSASKSDAVQQSFGLTPPAAALIPGLITNPIVAGGFPGISVTGYFGGSGLGRLGSPDFLPKFQHTSQFEYIDTVSWLRGNHSFKFGTDLIAPMKNQYMDVPATRGSMGFGGTFSGNAMADFLLGYVASFQLSNVYVVDQRHWASMSYVQDDWKVSDHLTMNLGLRYDFITPAMEGQNRQTNFDPSTGTLVFAKAGSLQSRGLVKPDTNNFGPRIGVVYKLNDRTVLRGGWGLFYNLFDRVGSEDQLALNLPGLINTSLQRTTGTPLFLLKDGIPNNFLTLPSLNPADGQLKSIRVRAVSNDAPKTTMQQASAGMQREVGGGMLASADFIYTRGSNLATLVNLNQPLPSAPGANDAKGALPYPSFGFIEWRAQNGKSTYSGLDAGLEKRFSHGYSIGVSYTLGNAKDNGSEQLTTQGSASFPQNARDFSGWWGPSDYDVRHRFSTNFVVNLPLGHSLLGRDWVVSGVYAARSGRPFTVNQSNNNVGQNMTGLPNFTGNASGARTVDQWFNPAAFTPVASGLFGNEQRNRLTGPGFQSFDLTVQRKLTTGHGANVTLRWDAFNLFNTTNLGLPNRNISGGDVGTITSLSGDARVMQLAVRVTF